MTIPLHRARATFHPRPLFDLVRYFPGEVAAIRKVIRDRAIDVVQVEGLIDPHAAIAGRREDCAIIWQLLDTRPPMSVRRLMMPLVVRLADVVMSTGLAVGQVHPGAEALGDRLRPFFPPVDSDDFRAENFDGADARRSYGFSADDLVLVSVGNLNPQKGHEFLLQAVGLLRRGGRSVKAVIVGASHDTHVAYERELHVLCGRLGLEIGKDVVFAGGLDDVRPALAAADIFVLSSVPRSEGVPTAAEEAMMMSVPVVATDVGGVAELVEDGVTGFVVPPPPLRRVGGRDRPHRRRRHARGDGRPRAGAGGRALRDGAVRGGAPPGLRASARAQDGAPRPRRRSAARGGQVGNDQRGRGMTVVVVTGSCGLIGSEAALALRVARPRGGRDR